MLILENLTDGMLRTASAFPFWKVWAEWATDCSLLWYVMSHAGQYCMQIRVQIQMGDPKSYHPPPERLSTWFAQTKTPFEPLEAARSMTHRIVKCPKCSTVLTTRESF